MAKDSFKGKNVIVTGASSGIGLDLIKELSTKGANILAVDFDKDGLEKISSDYKPITGTLYLDLSEKESTDRIISWIKSNWSKIDYCFANAGKAEYGYFQDQDWQDMDKLFQLNVHSPIQLGLSIRKNFPSDSFRHIITASAMSYWAVPGYSIYGSTKAALLQWAETLWAEKEGDWLSLVFPIATKTSFFNQKGKNIPQAWPSQEANTVALCMLNGAIRGKKKIYPSTLFRIVLVMNRWLGIIKPIMTSQELKRYRSWLEK